MSLKTLFVSGLLVASYLVALMVLRWSWSGWRRLHTRRQETDSCVSDFAGSSALSLTDVTEGLRRQARGGTALAMVWVWLLNTVVVWTHANALGGPWNGWAVFPALAFAVVGTVLVRHRLALGRSESIRRWPRSGLHVLSLASVGSDFSLGYLLFALALWVLWIVGAILVIDITDDGLDATIWELAERTWEAVLNSANTPYVAAIFAGSLVVLAFARRRQRSFRGAGVPPASDVLIHDRRPPILLLRAFEHDRIVVPTSSPWGRPLIDVVWPVTVDELESVLARVVSRQGPAIALSRPSSQHGRGSARDRAPTSDWLSHVLSRGRGARLIVAVAGDSPGLRAELDALAAQPELRSKSVVVVPPGIGSVDAASMNAFGVDAAAASTKRLVAFTDREWFADDRVDEFSYAAAIDAVIESTRETWQLREQPGAGVRTGLRIGYEVPAIQSRLRRWNLEYGLAIPVQVFIDGTRRGEFALRTPLDLELPSGSYDVQIQVRNIFRWGPGRLSPPVSSPKRDRSGQVRSDAKVVVREGAVAAIFVGRDRSLVRVTEDESMTSDRTD